MADIHLTTSTYDTGTNDTFTPVVDDETEVLDEHQNGPASAIVAIQTILGTGTTLKGSVADLVARLAVALEANGKIKDFDASSKTTFPPTTDEGCLGDVTSNLVGGQVLARHLTEAKVISTGVDVPVGGTGSLVTETNTQTLTNKTLTSPIIGDYSNMPHDHLSTGGGALLGAASVGLTQVKTVVASTTTPSAQGNVVTSHVFSVGSGFFGPFTITPSDAGRGTITIEAYHAPSTASASTGQYRLLTAGDGSGVNGTIQVSWNALDTVT